MTSKEVNTARLQHSSKRAFLFNRGETEMRKVHRAVKKGPNKWERKTGWDWDTNDWISLGILLIIVGYVVTRAIIG
jgi:hypothetical protein